MATKIKDGLFIGDAEASQDPEFIELNKITFVINCAGRQLPNLWEQHGLHYLTFPWTSDPGCVLFDGGNVVIVQITNFIDEALEKGDSVLVHSLDGTGRCIACLTAYLMFRHRWGFEKTLDFLCSKRPDASPNAEFVQQLYHLDLRLCAQWYGANKEPPESERLRHNQWVPIVPDLPPRSGHRQHTDGRRPGQQASVTSDSRGESAAASTTANATAGRFGAAASGFPPLGHLSEVQEEEIVLVHSFLNSQPQIDALPPGRADYEDHVSKELHWIDRPRIDKLAAAGRLCRKDRRQHIIPVSPRTGQAVPERPGNSSYNALSRDEVPTSMTTLLVGILKQDKIDVGTRNSGGKSSSRPRALASQSGARGLEATASGDDAVAAASAGSGGGGTLLPSRRAGIAKVEDEVVVEDLSEPRSDRWSAGGDGMGAGKSDLESASGGDTSNSSTHVQASHLVDDSSTEDEDAAPRVIGGKHDGKRAPEEASGRESSAPAVRQEERQAWDGRRASDAAPDVADERKARVGNRRGIVAVQHATTRGEENTSTPPSAPTTRGSNHPSKGSGIFPDKSSLERAPTRWDGKDTMGGVGDGRRRDSLDKTSGPTNNEANTDLSATAAVKLTSATLTKPKLRRRGSEGSLIFSTAEISTSTGLAQDKKYLPQAPGGRSASSGKQAPTDLPGPGWGPADVQHNKEAPESRRREQEEGMAVTRREAYRKEQLGWGREGSEQGLYPAGEGGGSLQQLAQTPNPQQRRLPSPRPQPEHGQGGTNGKSARSWPMLSPEVLAGSGGRDRGGDGPRDTSAASSALGSGNYSSAELLRSARTPTGTATNTESRGADARRPGRDRSKSGGPLPREIRASQAAAPSAEPSRAGGVGFAGPSSTDRLVGALSTEFTRSVGARRAFGSSGHPSQARSLPQPSAGMLPAPSRRGGSSDGGASGGEGGVRWANPSPRGRPGDLGASSVAYAQSGPIDSGGGGGGGVPARARKNLGQGYSPPISKRTHSSQGGGPRSTRSGGAPIYRSGSPAPTRGRRSATAASTAASGSAGVAGMSDAERFLNRNIMHGPRQPQQGSGIPPGFRGYIAPNGGGGGEGFGRKSTTRRSPAPSPTARDRRRRIGGDGFGRQDATQRGERPRGLSPGAIPRSSPVDSSPGQRPSTSEGLAGGGGGGSGLRGRSPNPVPRPSSASGRRRSPSPAPANPLGGVPIRRSTSRTGVSMDGSFDRPRWK